MLKKRYVHKHPMKTFLLSCSMAALWSMPGSAEQAAVPELRFADFKVADDFHSIHTPASWKEVEVPFRQPRAVEVDLYRLTHALDLSLESEDGEPLSARVLPGHRLWLDDGGQRLEYHTLSATWSWLDRQAGADVAESDLTPEQAALAARSALGKVVDLSDRPEARVVANIAYEETEDGTPGRQELLSYNVFFHATRDGFPLVGGGAVSSATIAGKASKPRVLSMAHAPADFESNGIELDARSGHLLREQDARQKLLTGDVLLAETPPDGVESGTVTRVARGLFTDGRYLHREAIPIYAYEVLFQPLAGEAFSRDYFVSALTGKGWQALGVDAEAQHADSRVRPGRLGLDMDPPPLLWQEPIPLEPEEHVAVETFASAHCVPSWQPTRRSWQASPFCPTLCEDRDDVCNQLSGDRKYSLTVRWAGLSTSHIPDLPGNTVLPASYKNAWVDRLRRSFDEACFEPTNQGNNGYVGDDLYQLRPDLQDIETAGEEADFLFHMSHGWGLEEVECPGVGRRYSNIIPHGNSLVPPAFFPTAGPSHFTSCSIQPSWSGRRLRYFFTMASYSNAGRRQWTRVVGGGTDQPKVVIGPVSHGNRFHFSPWAPEPGTSPPTNAQASYPNMISTFFRHLSEVDTSSILSCASAGLSFREAMREAVKGTATSQSDYHWGAIAHRRHPKVMRLVFSTYDQLMDEHLPGWGPQLPNDGNYLGWAYEAQGSEP